MSLAPPTPGAQLALVQLRRRLRRALRRFRTITGMSAVTSIAPSLPPPGSRVTISPPMHPECARRLRSGRRSPCREQWMQHLRASRRSARPHHHVCPLGMHCSCVPVHLDGRLVGVAKLVAGSRAPATAFAAAIGVLRLAVSETCQEALVSVLAEQVRGLRQRVADFERTQSGRRPNTAAPDPPTDPAAADAAEAQSAALVDRALAYLQHHYCQPALSLSGIARALGCNPRYLTSRFTRVVGERMHAHLLALRVAHACRLLMETRRRVKEIAFASGFSGLAQMEGAFRKQVGVSPGRYRRIFAGP